MNNTAEAVATGYTYQSGETAGSIAIATKLCRVVMLGAVVTAFASRLPRSSQVPAVRSRTSHFWARLPKFVLVFFGFSLLAGTGLLSPQERESLRNVSSWLFLIAFAGIGFKLRWSDIRGIGPRPLVAISLGSLLLGVLSLGAAIALEPLLF